MVSLLKFDIISVLERDISIFLMLLRPFKSLLCVERVSIHSKACDGILLLLGASVLLEEELSK